MTFSIRDFINKTHISISNNILDWFFVKRFFYVDKKVLDKKTIIKKIGADYIFNFLLLIIGPVTQR